MSAQSRATGDPRWVRVVLIGATLAFLGLFLFVPLVSVFVEAFRKGVVVYAKAITEENARAMGEFGAVSVVSGHIRGQTNTLPLHVEVLYNEYNMAAAFACASILSVLGLVTLLLKTLIEWRAGLRRRTH